MTEQHDGSTEEATGRYAMRRRLLKVVYEWTRDRCDGDDEVADGGSLAEALGLRPSSARRDAIIAMIRSSATREKNLGTAV